MRLLNLAARRSSLSKEILSDLRRPSLSSALCGRVPCVASDRVMEMRGCARRSAAAARPCEPACFNGCTSRPRPSGHLAFQARDIPNPCTSPRKVKNSAFYDTPPPVFSVNKHSVLPRGAYGRGSVGEGEGAWDLEGGWRGVQESRSQPQRYHDAGPKSLVEGGVAMREPGGDDART
ncbi:hypothetical protein BD626DRAFT_83781 [Schizophyllum amplum]|uniref:Uncharacterized protein n=1 Tax=Schizophyllum amplum TaxID=97359 RepID=A0A550C8U1_9AGAR|nr:hypothetical protein BD626DRAFT_83781 [Auriculariopsis ampla]